MPPHRPVRRDRQKALYPVRRDNWGAYCPARRDKARVFGKAGSGSFLQ